MMNIMIITPKIPYPLNEGGKISQFAIIDYLRRIHSVILVLATYTDEDEKNDFNADHPCTLQHGRSSSETTPFESSAECQESILQFFQ